MRAPRVRRGRLALALLLAAVVPHASAQGPSTPALVVRREIRVGVAGVPTPLDPSVALEGAVPLIAHQVFDTLVAYRKESTDVEPALATRWTVSPDGLVWSFTLRDNVRFHDGTPLTAAEVVASFERQLHAQTPPSPDPWAAFFRGRPGVVREVRAPDPRTVQIVLVQPYAPLLTVLAHPALAVARSSTAESGLFTGTGPYRVVDASPGRLALEAAPGYWGTPPRSPRIVFLEVATDDEAEAALDSKTLDVWFPASPPRRTEGALAIPGTHVGYLTFQTEKEPFSRQKVRQAVAAALDPAVIGLALGRAAVPLQSFLPAGIWARREGSPVLGAGRAVARRLLAAGGFTPGAPPTLLVPVESDPVNLPKLAEAMQVMLGAAQMPVVLREEPPDAVRAILQKGEHDLALVEAAVVGGDPHLFLFPLSTGEAATKGPRALNFSFYRNARLDDTLIRASQLSYRPERRRLYQRAQGLLAVDLPWLPIYVRLYWAVVRPEVRGLRLHPTGFPRLDTLALEAPVR